MMDRYTHLTHFINRIVSDNRLRPIHISLAVALCQRWISNQLQQPYRVSRRVLMSASRIRSKATYHKALKELQAFGYLKYSPSYHPRKASEVEILDAELNTNADESKEIIIR